MKPALGYYSEIIRYEKVAIDIGIFLELVSQEKYLCIFSLLKDNIG